MQNLPEMRLVMSFDGTEPRYVVFKGHQGWYGVPGLKPGLFLTDDDVKDAIPLMPRTDVTVTAHRKANGMFDVDINGKMAARNTHEMSAGTFVVQAALMANAPITVTATRSEDPGTLERAEPAPLSVVRTAEVMP